MIRVRDIVLAFLIAAVPLTGAAVAQDDDRSRQDKAREEARDGQRMELGEIVRRLESIYDGSMVGVRPQGGNYVIRWAYPPCSPDRAVRNCGRIADITVDGRTGRVIGER